MKRKWVGQSVERVEDEALLTGTARFIDDLEPLAGLCHAAILRSPHGHADIRSIDAEAARRLPGVIGVLTGRDVAAFARPIGTLVSRDLDYPCCAVDRVRYFGEPVAVVVANDRYVAEDALDLIRVDYAPRAAVVDPERAAASDAPVLHDRVGGNIVHRREFVYGEPDAAFAAAYKIARCKVSYPRVNSTPIETYGVIADYDRAAKRYTVWSNFQGPYSLHPVICDALRVRGNQLRLISAPSSGGSFGIKQSVYPYIVLIGAVSRHVGRPVKWIEDRLEHLAASSASSGRVTEMEGAFDRDGVLTGLRIRQLENVGAYIRPPDPAALYRMHSTLSGPYRVRNIAVENRAVVTNQLPSGLNRGFGGPQFFYPLERLMDNGAKALGIDPVELRLRNVVRTGEFPYDTPAGSVLDSGDYAGAIRLALSRGGIDALRAERETARTKGRKFGIGMALAVETSASNMAYVNLAMTHAQREKSLPKSGANGRARVIMDALGSVIVHIDSVPNGQGHRTVVAQIVADELGVNPADVEVLSELDTFGGVWSITSGNYANRFSTTVTSAVMLASRKASAKLRAAAGAMLGVPAERVELAGGYASAPGSRNEPVPIRRLAAQLHWNTDNLPEGVDGPISELAEFSPPGLSVPDAQDRMRSSLTYSFQCDLVAVEVDPETGRVEVRRYISVHDAGTQLNPAVVEGQLRGGFAHGFGAAMFERVTYRADGTLISATFQDYLCPTAPELPELVFDHLVSPSPNTLHGAKGLGDGCSMITPVAMANAIADATGIDDLVPPFLPGRLWEQMQGRDPDPQLSAAASSAQSPATQDAELRGQYRGEGEVTVDASRERVWAALLAPDSLKDIIPGCETVQKISETDYRARVRVSVAGIGGVYEVAIRLSDLEPPQALRLGGRGESALGHGNGEARVRLDPLPGGRTRLRYRYAADAGGKLAAFGQRMLEGVLRILIDTFFARLAAHLRGEAPAAGPASRFRAFLQMLRLLWRKP
jgi:2-furoyl-CoA dehydrogenase large subunit